MASVVEGMIIERLYQWDTVVLPYFSLSLISYYRVYQKEVNSLKNDSKLQRIKYSFNILF